MKMQGSKKGERRGGAPKKKKKKKKWEECRGKKGMDTEKKGGAQNKSWSWMHPGRKKGVEQTLGLVEGSKSNVAMNAWLPQASYPVAWHPNLFGVPPLFFCMPIFCSASLPLFFCVPIFCLASCPFFSPCIRPSPSLAWRPSSFFCIPNFFCISIYFLFASPHSALPLLFLLLSALVLPCP